MLMHMQMRGMTYFVWEEEEVEESGGAVMQCKPVFFSPDVLHGFVLWSCFRLRTRGLVALRLLRGLRT